MQVMRPVLAAALAALVAAGCGAATPTSDATQTQSASIGPAATASGAAPASAEPSGLSESPSTGPASPSAGPSATPGPTPTPAPSPGAAATITVQQLKLDASKDAEGTNRSISFTTQGTGTVTVRAVVRSSSGRAILCLARDGTSLGCKTTADGSISAKATRQTSSWKATLRGEDVATPIVDVTLGFPAAKAAITIENARFDGTDYPETNGIQALLTPRKGGDASLAAKWGGHPFLYEIDLIEQGGSGGTTLANQGPATGASESLPVLKGSQWRLLLQNIEGGFGPTPLTVTIGWP